MKISIFICSIFVFGSLWANQDAIFADLIESAKSEYRASEYIKAIAKFETASKQLPKGIKSDVLNYNLGLCHFKLKDYPKAVFYFEKLKDYPQKAPDYLKGKNYYNYLISCALASEEELNKSDGIEFDKVRAWLCKAEEILKNQELTQLFNEPSAILEGIADKIKGLRSKERSLSKNAAIHSLNFSQTLQLLKTHLSEQLSEFNQLAQKEISPSMTRYFLNQYFVKHQNSFPFWDHGQKLFEKELQEHAQDSAQENSQEMFLNFYQSAFNEFITSLDSMKEASFWSARFSKVCSKVYLDLLSILLSKKDLVKYTLDERFKTHSEQNSVDRAKTYYQSLTKQLKFLSHWAEQGLNEYCNMLEKENLDTQKALKLSLCNLIKSNLKMNTSVEYDVYLYEQVYKNPDKIIFPIYKKTSKEKEFHYKKSEIQFPIKATQKRFELLGKLNDDLNKKEQIIKSKEYLANAYQSYLNEDRLGVKAALENFLSQWDLKSFLNQKAQEIKEMLFANKLMEQDNERQLQSELTHLLEMTTKASENTLDKEIQQLALDQLKNALKSHEYKKEIEDEKMSSFLYNNVAQSLTRIIQQTKDLPSSSQEVLRSCVEEQKHSKALIDAYPKVNKLTQNADEEILTWAKKAQDAPLNASDSFVATYYQETAQLNEGEEQSSVVETFEKGRLSAKKAQSQLQQEVIDWEQVSALQNEAIECWQKLLNKNAPNKSDESSQGESKGNESQSTDNNLQEKVDESLNAMSSSESDQMKESEREQKNQQMSSIFEALQEMQKDDKIVEHKSQRVQKGLRPW